MTLEKLKIDKSYPELATELGSGLIHSQKMKAVAKAIADRKV